LSIGRRWHVDTGLRLVVLVATALVACPSAAFAQRDAFVEAVLPFYRALAGVYGDEGSQVATHLEALATALTRWDRALAATEITQRARLDQGDVRTRLEAHTVLASLYAERGQFEKAVREAEEAVRADPTRSALHRFKAILYQAAGRPADAADAFRAAWLVEPSDARNAYHLVVHRSTQTTRPELDRARRTLAEVEQGLIRGQRASTPSPFDEVDALSAIGGSMAFVPSAYTPGFTLVLNGEFDAGIAVLKRAVNADPLVADPVLRSEPMAGGIASLRRGSVTPAIALLEAAVVAAPDSSEANRILGTAHAIHGDIERGLRHFKNAVRLDPKNERGWVGLARTLDAAGRLEETVDVLQQGIAELPDSGTLRWMRSRTAGRRQRTDDGDLELIAIADRLVLLAGRGDLYGSVATLAQQHLNDDRAVELLEQRVALTPNNAAAHKALGVAYVDKGQEDEGYAELVIALMLDATDAETITSIGRLHVSGGRYADAVVALTRAVSIQPSHAQAVHALGMALAATGRTFEAGQRLKESEQLQGQAVEQQRRSRTAGMLALQAELRMREGHHEAAIPLWQRVIELENVSATDYLRQAESLAAVGRLEDAVVSIEMAISRKAGPEAHRRLADAYAALGRRNESVRERRTYVELRLQELRAAAGEATGPGQ
jgi:tetratricopeptide (TPR) repeat protein